MWGRRVLNPKAVVKANVPTLTSVKQETGTKLTATLAAPVEKVDLADVAIVCDDSHSVIAVKSVTVDTADATKLSIETYVSMTDGKSYTLTYTAQDEAKTQSTATFTATDGKIASFALTTATIPANRATTIKYRALDANGVVIYEKPINDKGDGIDIEVATDKGYQEDAKLTLYEVGDTATVTVSYHTYKYDADGNETGLVKNVFTVTAVNNSATVSDVKYTIVDSGTVPAWENVTVNTRIAMEDSKVALFQIKDSNGDDITAECGYTVESSNDNIVLASGEVSGEVSLVPVKEGSAFLVLKDKDKTMKTLAITVVKARSLSTFTLNKTSVAIAESAGVNELGSVAVGFSAKDQYGDAIKITSLDIESKTVPATGNKSDVDIDYVYTDTKPSKGDIQIATNEAKPGTYTYSITANDAKGAKRTQTFTVNVKDTSKGTKAYGLQFTNGAKVVSGVAATTSLNTTVDKNSAEKDSVISVNIVQKNNGVISGVPTALTLKSILVKGSNGKTYADIDATKAANDKIVSSSAIVSGTCLSFATQINNKPTDGNLLDITAVSYDGDTFTKVLPAGSYTVTVKATEIVSGKETTRTITDTFKVEDKQPTLIPYVLKTNSTASSTINDVLADKDFVKYVYGGVTQQTKDDNAVTVSTVYAKQNGKTIAVSKATVRVALGNNKYVNIVVPISRVFTAASDWGGVIEDPTKAP